MANSFYEDNPDLLAINTWASKNANNDSVKGLANDLFYNYASANLQTRSDTDYAKQMAPLALDYQKGQQDIATQADLQRLAAEGDLVRGLTDQQGRFTTLQKEIEAGAARYGADAQRDVGFRQSLAEEFGAERTAEAAKYGAEKTAEAAKYGADRQLEGQRYGFDSQERQIGLTGEQERLNKQQDTTEQLRLRADARGAIRTASKSFYG